MSDEQIECDCTGTEHCPYLGDLLDKATEKLADRARPGSQYDRFLELTTETYKGCSTEQKLAMFVQHYPAAVVPFLLELLLRLYPEDPTDDTRNED